MSKYIEPNLVIRSLHDVGLAGWFGGSVMGAVGLAGAAEAAGTSPERAKATAKGWARWTPVAAAAIAAHLAGGTGILLANKGRVMAEQGPRRNTAVKTVLLGLALGSTAYAGVLGLKMNKLVDEGESDGKKSDELVAVEKQLNVLAWTTPVLTGTMLVLSAAQGEQQRPGLQLREVFKTVTDKLPMAA